MIDFEYVCRWCGEDKAGDWTGAHSLCLSALAVDGAEYIRTPEELLESAVQREVSRRPLLS